MRSEWTLSGREAVLRARQSMELGDAFHAYIIDWCLPDMNGIEVTRQIRSLGDDTPIIILTAYDWSDIEAEAKAAGVTAFLCETSVYVRYPRNLDDCYRPESGWSRRFNSSGSRFGFQRQMYIACGR